MDPFPLHRVAVQLCTRHTPPLANYLTKQVPHSPGGLLALRHQKANLANKLPFLGVLKALLSSQPQHQACQVALPKRNLEKDDSTEGRHKKQMVEAVCV